MLILFKISSLATLALLNTNESAISRIKCHLDIYSLRESTFFSCLVPVLVCFLRYVVFGLLATM